MMVVEDCSVWVEDVRIEGGGKKELEERKSSWPVGGEDSCRGIGRGRREGESGGEGA